MALLEGSDFTDLFRMFRHAAFHLEQQDTYSTPEEDGPLSLFLAGKPDDFAWHQPWLALVREVTRSGRQINRARVVTVPHSDYQRWGLSVAPLNIEAGENIRWLPRHLTEGIDFPPHDYWLFDDDRLIFSAFGEDGRWLGGTESSDRNMIEHCQRVRDQVWERAIPHYEYVASSYVSA